MATMNTPSSILIFGATGLTGSHTLSTLVSAWPSARITTISRRQPSTTSPNLTAILESDTSKWASQVASIAPKPDTVISALGTTRAAAGGLANQWKIDHDLNVELVQAAKDAGAKTFVFISGTGIRGMVGKYLPYSKMKIGVEDKIQDTGFDQAIVLRPAALLGERDHHRTAEGIVSAIFRNLDAVGIKDRMSVEGEVVGRAVAAALKITAEGKAPEKFWVIENSDIIRLGRDEWKAEEKPAAQ